MEIWRNFLIFTNVYAAAIQAISAVVLVIVTGIYTVLTRHTVLVMSKEYKLNARPYAVPDKDLHIEVQQEGSDPNKIAEKTTWIEIRYTIVNLGRVPAVFSVEPTNFDNKKEIKIKSTEIVLYPSQLIYHTAHYDIPEIKVYEIKGVAGIKIIYWALDVPKKKFYHHRVFEIQAGKSPYHILKDEAGEVV